MPMLTQKYSWLKKAAVGALAVLMLIPAAQAVVIDNAPDIVTASATPNPFNPSEDGNLNITWTHTGDALIEIEILDTGFNTVRDIVGPTDPANFSKPVKWNGKMNNGQMAPEGSYYALVIASNGIGKDQVSVPFTLEESEVTPEDDAPVITGDFASPNPFDPNTEDTTIFYTIDDTDDDADVTVRIRNSSNTVVRTFSNASETSTNWDGRNGSGTIQQEGIYTYEITATNDFGTDVETGTVEIEYDDNGGNNGNNDAPVITGDFASPNPFDPNEEDTTIFYTIDDSDDDADVTVRIYRNSTLIRTFSNTSESSTDWDGRNSSGTIQPEDVYTYEITATNDFGTDVETGTVEIEFDDNGGGNGDAPEIEVHYVSPNPFDPDEENTRIYFRLDMDAEVTIEIEDGGERLRRIINRVVRSGDVLHSVTWDGEDDSGDELDDDTYRYVITACNVNDDDECDEAFGNVRIDRDGNGGNGGNGDDDLISDVRVNNAVFDPTENEESEICFDIERDDTDIEIDILDGGKVIRELVDSNFDEASGRCFEWDGEDDDGDIVDDDVYQYRVRAERNNDIQVELAYTEVDTDGRRIGFPEGCGGFRDIDENSPFCRAIELMFYRGIFSGYPDGTFRPYADINRAEATKVIVEALGYDIVDNNNNNYYGNVGFRDVYPGAWYIPYLQTARQHGIINGYPDGTFRPGATMNRVELLKVFLEATNINIPYCTVQPYADTPINYQTRWYIDYVCFAKAYGLMGSTYGGNFNPAAPVSRADVANLFYQFEIRGLFNGYNSNYYNNYYNGFSNYYNGNSNYNYNYYDPGYYNTYNYGGYNYSTPTYVNQPMYYY